MASFQSPWLGTIPDPSSVQSTIDHITPFITTVHIRAQSTKFIQPDISGHPAEQAQLTHTTTQTDKGGKVCTTHSH